MNDKEKYFITCRNGGEVLQLHPEGLVAEYNYGIEVCSQFVEE